MALDETIIVRTLMADRAKLLAYIWSIVHDAHLVEDVFQEVSLLALRKRSELQDEKALSTWLRKSARLLALTAVRGKVKRPVLLGEDVLDKLDAAWGEADARSAAASLDLLHRCLAKLSERSRQFVALRYMERLSGAQVAAKLGTTVHSVYVALGRAHRLLRDCMKKQNDAEGVTHD